MNPHGLYNPRAWKVSELSVNDLMEKVRLLLVEREAEISKIGKEGKKRGYSRERYEAKQGG